MPAGSKAHAELPAQPCEAKEKAWNVWLNGKVPGRYNQNLIFTPIGLPK
jgi:hypothetical protein